MSHYEEQYEEMYAEKRAKGSDGGPTSYYDFQPDWKTLNDMMEWLAVNRWGPYSLHMKDDMKASFRFGAKGDTSKGYDCRKKVYSGLRMLMMAEGKGAVKAYLAELSEDAQFK